MKAVAIISLFEDEKDPVAKAEESVKYREDILKGWEADLKEAQLRLSNAEKLKREKDIPHAKKSVDVHSEGVKNARESLDAAKKHLAEVKAK